MSNTVNIDIVLDKLSRQISQLSVENAVLTSQVESLNQRIQELESDASDSGSDFE